MLNTRPKINKTLETCFPQASLDDSDQQSTESGAIIGSNDDLFIEILLRLPVASIFRFKSVSKHWRLLLSDRHFTQRYDSLLKSPGLFAGDIYVPFDVENPNIITPPFRSLDSYFDRSGFSILQSCNGLLLCSTDRGPKGFRNSLRYYVFNPTTKQLALVPFVPGGRKVHNTIRFMGLAFHPTDCPLYKVVCIRSLESDDPELFQIQLYSSDTRKWKISVESFSMYRQVFFRDGVYWNGAVFWAPLFYNYLYFKLDVEQLQTMPLPEGMMSLKISTKYFGESRGHLHLIVEKHRRDDVLQLNVYEMLSDHSGWFVKYQLQLHELLGPFPEIQNGYGFSVLDVVRGEDEEDTFIVLKIPEKFITYNVHDKSYKKIYSLTREMYYRIFGFYRYTESLSSF